ncbi:hypothetical protein PF005_g23500 [Phytophthora fragariae]|uniref:Uncharacterized protein n=2 Tax=Phytophthora TaxID=4783 RepID=A0A6A3F7G2_9STRA|nr:hypothetical protein PF009_g8301 [Phytophthora fragariae]KAE8986229.1 hypothetical protein PR002_g22415 [Phytophthora rubi]KAE8980855.1 hypothetical protein PF011_g22264 [Phytophthora fragariae]KAE9079386.1 hypothetical protein PF007_g23473 [Phytophthora fragariae]KAE9095855.1 hypothetical protein PF010_g16556 [Phytophthora fragariae]
MPRTLGTSSSVGNQPGPGPGRWTASLLRRIGQLTGMDATGQGPRSKQKRNIALPAASVTGKDAFQHLQQHATLDKIARQRHARNCVHRA